MPFQDSPEGQTQFSPIEEAKASGMEKLQNLSNEYDSGDDVVLIKYQDARLLFSTFADDIKRATAMEIKQEMESANGGGSWRRILTQVLEKYLK